MAAPDNVVNLNEKFSAFTEHWSPKIVGEINAFHLKLVKVQGEFVWHNHQDTDELFLVQRGRLTIQLRDRADVVLGAGEFFVVPKGVEHRPVAENECQIVILEPADVVNTGDTAGSERTAEDEWI